ncbi:hypothetical protein MASR1M60_22720 [Rhodocyclaceae bacterium]
MDREADKQGFNCKVAVDLLGKVIGGRNALIAGVIGLAVGFGMGALTVTPSDSKCAEYYKEQVIKNKGDDKLWRDWLTKKNSWG